MNGFEEMGHLVGSDEQLVQSGESENNLLTDKKADIQIYAPKSQESNFGVGT